MERFPWLRGAVIAGVAVGVLLLVIFALGWLVARLHQAIEVLVVATLVALAIDPLVEWLDRRRIPRGASVTIVIVVVVGAVAGLGIWLLPVVASQVTAFLGELPGYWQQFQDTLAGWFRRIPALRSAIERAELGPIIAGQSQRLLSLAGNVAVVATRFVAAVVLVALATVFILINPRPLLDGLLRAWPARYEAHVRAIAGQVAYKLRAWVQGIVILGAIIGVAVGLGLWALGIPFAVLFGLIAGLLEVVPTLGPVLSAIPPTLIGLSISPLKGILVIVLFVVVQQLESNLVTPLVMSRKLELHPLTALVSLIVMTELLGLFGAIIALPTVAVLKVLYEMLYLPAVHPLPEIEAEVAPSRPAAPPEPPPAETGEGGEHHGPPPGDGAV